MALSISALHQSTAIIRAFAISWSSFTFGSNRIDSVRTSMHCKCDPHQARSIQMRPPIWLDSVRSNRWCKWFCTFGIKLVGVTRNTYVCWRIMVMDRGGNVFMFQNINEPQLQYLVLVINNYGTVSTLCVSECVRSNQAKLSRSHIYRSVV